MIYGPSYEGKTRECESCDHVTNVHHSCEVCNNPVCEKCDEGPLGGGHYCSIECRQEACEHQDVAYELYEDVGDEYVTYAETWTCCDCGAHLDQDGDPIRKSRIFARRAA